MQGDLQLLLTILLPIAAAPLAYALGHWRKASAVWVLTLISAVSVASFSVLLNTIQQGNRNYIAVEGICSFGIAFRTDGFRALYALIASVMWLITSIYSFDFSKDMRNLPRYAFFTLMTLGATLGVILSDDLFTLYLFFEIMSLCSYPWVAHRETAQALRAADSYIYIAIIGGLCMLMGLLLLPQSLVIAPFDTFATLTRRIDFTVLWLPALLLLIGFGAKAGAFPLHVWMPQAYPAAPAPASALLSGMLSKAGVFGIMVLSIKLMPKNLSWGELIFWLGIVTMAVGALLALLSNDLKRVLACSSMSQIGFILIGVGLTTLLAGESGPAAWGTIGHMVNHSLFKLLLFLCAGAVMINAHTTTLSDIRGFGRSKPILHIVFLSALLGISGLPFFSGFVSKSLLHESLNEYIHHLTLENGNPGAYATAETLFVIGGGLTLAYMLKVYVCVFWQLNPTRQAEYDGMKRYLSPVSKLLLLLCGLLPLLLGIMPETLMGGIGKLTQDFFGVHYRGFKDIFIAENIVGAVKSFVIGSLVYIVIVRPLLSILTSDGYHEYPDSKPRWLDLENMVYRPLLRLLTFLGLILARALEKSTDTLLATARHILLLPVKERTPLPGSNRFTYAIGSLLDFFVKVLNYTLWRKAPAQPHFVCALAAGNEEANRQIRRLTRSISFGLLMVCLGLFVTIGYLLLN